MLLLASCFSRHTSSRSSRHLAKTLFSLNTNTNSSNHRHLHTRKQSPLVFKHQPPPLPPPLFLNSFILKRIMSNAAAATTAKFQLLSDNASIVRATQDTRSYKVIQLNNGIKCLLVSDPLTDRSAASLDVNAGYMLDPAEFPGLAHFCEHMLFMGSKKVFLHCCCLSPHIFNEWDYIVPSPILI
jgi:hypothetical protein